MPQKREWTNEEIEQIIKWYTKDKFSINYIATQLLKCRPSFISTILKENNITIRKKGNKRITNIDEEKTIIDLYVNQKYSQSQIAEKFSCSTFVIHNVLKNNNIEIVNQPKLNKNQNNNYFDKIDTEHKAYWLGFLFADGCIFNNQLSIEIHEKDKELLEKFKEDLNLNSKISIRHRKNTVICCIRMSSKHLCDTLSNYGIVQNKTKNTRHLPDVPTNLIPHFLRGLIDGDGWISIDKAGYYHIGFVNNYQSTCEDFRRYCNIVTNNLCGAKITYKDGTPCFQVQGKEATKQLATALYQGNTICLSRKYRLVEPLFDFKNDEDIV